MIFTKSLLSRVVSSSSIRRSKLYCNNGHSEVLRNKFLYIPEKNHTNGMMMSKRQIHFLPFLGLWVGKHLSSWTIYNACKAYGWPKVYRRLLEQNRSANSNNASRQQKVQFVIRQAIEAPPKFAAQLSEYMTIILPFLQTIAKQTEPNLPRFLVVAIRYIINSQKPAKIFHDFLEVTTTKKK